MLKSELSPLFREALVAILEIAEKVWLLAEFSVYYAVYLRVLFKKLSEQLG